MLGDVKEITVSSTEQKNVENILIALDFTFDQRLMKESISYYDVLIQIEAPGARIEDTIVISKFLKQFCYWGR